MNLINLLGAINLLSFSLNILPVAPKTKPNKITSNKATTNTKTIIPAVAKKLLTSGPVAPPSACADSGVACPTGVTCCSIDSNGAQLTCDTDKICRVANNSNCTPETQSCVLGSVCTNRNTIMPTCTPCSGTSVACLTTHDCCQPPNPNVTQAQSCQYVTAVQQNQCMNCLAIGTAGCIDNSACCEGAVCVQHSCVACIPAGHPCSTATEAYACCDGNSCQNGVCAACNELDSNCSSDLQCCHDVDELICLASKCTNCFVNNGPCDGINAHCCQGDQNNPTPQVCLANTCQFCKQLCGSCSATVPCCDGYSCLGNACCAQAGMPCIVPGAIAPNNPCVTSSFGTTGCCENLVCQPTDPKDLNSGGICQSCAIEGASCEQNSDCCQSEENLVCDGGTNTCKTSAFCDALNAAYFTGITDIFNNFNAGSATAGAYYPISTDVIEPGPCEVAFWAYFYNLQLLALYNWAISPLYGHIQCQPAVVQQIKTKMENSLRVMEAVCYNNSTQIDPAQLACLSANPISINCPNAVPSMSQCGLPPAGTPLAAIPTIGCCSAVDAQGNPVATPVPAPGQKLSDYLATLPQCLSISDLLYKYIWAKACQNPELNLGGSCTEFPTGFTPIAQLPNGVAPTIFTAANVYNDLSIGTGNIMVPFVGIGTDNQNYNNLKKLVNANNQIEIVDFINAIVDALDGQPIEGVMYRSNWVDTGTNACTCWNGQAATYAPAINLQPASMNLPIPNISGACVCPNPADLCVCDPQPNGAGGDYDLKLPEIKLFADGSGCSGQCWNGPCACTKDATGAITSTCYGVFTATPTCPASPTKCSCADGSACTCLNGSGIDGAGNTNNGTCNTPSCGCVNTNSILSPVPVDLVLDWIATDSTICATGAPAKQIEEKIGRAEKLENECFNYNGSDNYSCTIYNNSCRCCCASGSSTNTGQTKDACPANYYLEKQVQCVCADGKPCTPAAPPPVPTCTPACPSLQYGCCYDGSLDGQVSNPDCISNICCLNVVNAAIKNNAQSIADNLNAMLFLMAPSGPATGGVPGPGVPTDYLGHTCQIAQWALNVEAELFTTCSMNNACMNPGECNLTQSCVSDADCGGCVCDTTTGLCNGCIPAGHGCLGESSTECCQNGNCDMTTKTCVACVPVGHGCLGLSGTECCQNGSCDMTTQLCVLCVPPGDLCAEALAHGTTCCNAPGSDEYVCTDGYCANQS